MSKGRLYDHDAIRRDYASGLKLAYIALMHGCSINTVSVIANNAGLRRRELRRMRPEYLEAIKMYIKGEKIKVIREKTGLQYSQIYQSMSKIGVLKRRNKINKRQEKKPTAIINSVDVGELSLI